MSYNKSTMLLVSKSTNRAGHRHLSHEPNQMVSIKKQKKSLDHDAIPTASGSSDVTGISSLVDEEVSTT